MKEIVTEFLGKSDENYRLYEHLSAEKIFDGWQVVALFYSALCYVKAYLYSKNIKEHSINSHDSIRQWLVMEAEAKISNVISFYESLYRDSRDARYTTKKISKNRIQRCLFNYNKVKEKLMVKPD